MKFKTVPTRDFQFKGTIGDSEKILTRWPDALIVLVEEAGDSGEQCLAIHLGTASRKLATRRARELVKKLERNPL